jgi:four helix bundle protein
MNDEFKEKRNLRLRTKQFTLRIVHLYSFLAEGKGAAPVLAKQVLRSGTSVGAHYREATRARSVAEFISKIEAGLQELEETGYWLELLGESQIVAESRLSPLLVEVGELTAILVSSVKTAKSRRKGAVASGSLNGE